MRLSLDWLSEFVEFTVGDPQAIADAITAHAAEVDDVERQGAALAHCCVGKVLSIAKHPNADRLSLCTVQTDKGVKPVVCGGTNLRTGMRVAFAHVGATVQWHGEETVTLEPAEIRGQRSEGMICAAEELGLADRFPPQPGAGERAIVDLGDGDEGVGRALGEYLGLTGTVLHVDNHAITHRADLFSHVGFARECVAMGIARWKQRPKYKRPKFAKAPLPFKIIVECKDLVPRYAACLLEIDALGDTPPWMVRRLEAAGWRSVNLPVDITNYVTSEVGMPLHSFDAGDLHGNVRMRTSKKGETIVTLDSVERVLPDGSLVLSDDEGIFDLLGVMGGLRSSTTQKTRRIFLHSACVDPVSIRRTIIATGHRTDAATVYEKGIPPVVVEQGFLRALELFLALVPGARIVSAEDRWGSDGATKKIALSPAKVNAVLGTDLSPKQMVKILKDLEFTVEQKQKKLSVTPPLHRLGDIAGPHDLTEEIGRIYGFNTIEAELPQASIAPPARDPRLRQLRVALQQERYVEILPLSLLGPDLLRQCDMDPAEAVPIGNPLGEELSLMQPSALPRLLEHAGQNIRHVEDLLRTFHVGTVFCAGEDRCLELGALRARRRGTGLKQTPLLELKHDLSAAFAAAGYAMGTAPAAAPFAAAHPGRSAVVSVGADAIGFLFELTPAIAARFDLPPRTAVALADLTALFALPPATPVAKPVPLFPAVTYDETIPFRHDRHLAQVIAAARGASALLEHIEVADLYEGKGGAGGGYNLTLRCTYRSHERTLTEEEAKKEHGRVMKAFA